MNEHVPKVTVLMCVYNDEIYVGEAIESILSQTFTDFEFIIVNDGSTDGTLDILNKYAALDKRIRVCSQANAGTTAAANFGLSVALGVNIARLDSDDISYPHRLQTEVDFLDRNPHIALVGGGSDIIDLDGRIIGKRNIRTSSPARTLMHRCIYQQSDVMFRRDVVLSLGGYREKFRNAQDYDLWLRISEVAGIAKLNEVLGQWRLNGGGYTLSRAQEQAREVSTIKRFALQRRRNEQDAYATFVPQDAIPHRKYIGISKYDLWTGSILLQALRHKEARQKIRNYLKTNGSVYAQFLYMSTFLPKPLLAFIFSVRNYYLNNYK